MKNLHYLDLFQGTALSHNLKGRHNSCRAIIQAIPPEGNMRASPLAKAILHSFGISAAVAKITGKRNPESSVKAMFSALVQHQSLETVARNRGLKFLDLYHQRLWGFGMHDYHDCYRRDVDAYDPTRGKINWKSGDDILFDYEERGDPTVDVVREVEE